MAKKDDYIVFAPMPKKYALLKVSGNKNGIISGVLEKGCHVEQTRTVMDLAPKEVILNLGPEPVSGTVYGIDVGKRYFGRKQIDTGDLHFFYRPKKEVYNNIVKAFRVAKKQASKIGMERVFDQSIVWEIEPANKQKYAGMYRRAHKEVPNIIAIRPEVMEPSYYPYVIHHELGHHIHYEWIMGNDALQAKWLELYNSSIKVVNITRKELKELHEQFVSSQESIKDFMSSLDEDAEAKFKKVLRIIRQYQRFSIQELALLQQQGKQDVIEQVWPKHDISDRALDPVVSEYATVNVKELVAEAYAFYCTGVKLPKQVHKLMENTLTYVKKQIP